MIRDIDYLWWKSVRELSVYEEVGLDSPRCAGRRCFRFETLIVAKWKVWANLLTSYFQLAN